MNENFHFEIPNPTWLWDVFGNGLLRVEFNSLQKQPSLRVRILSRIILGSTWEKK